jgi:predicted nucleic acid-binding protein
MRSREDDAGRRETRIEDFDTAIVAHALTVDATIVIVDLNHMTRVPGRRVEGWNG